MSAHRAAGRLAALAVFALALVALAGCKSAPATPPTLAELKTAAAAGEDEAAGERPDRAAAGAPPPPARRDRCAHHRDAIDHRRKRACRRCACGSLATEARRERRMAHPRRAGAARAPIAPPPTADATTAPVLVAVHGFASEGAEWVAPLARLDAPDTRFYRWDWLTCPAPAADALVAALTALAAEPGVDRIRVVGHSYGGLVAALAARRYPGPDPLEVHVVAAPLAGSERLTAHCGPLDPGPAPAGPVTVRQWRTVHAQDGAFRDLPVDPQVVDWAGADVVALPADWQDGRLGHNRSLQWVAEQLATP
ncbi:MAG: alpha/beta hydrolase [Myxococcales bacterium]|nr:alpha/beta hydrolase [Myxococcales bacterium]